MALFVFMSLNFCFALNVSCFNHTVLIFRISLSSKEFIKQPGEGMIDILEFCSGSVPEQPYSRVLYLFVK